MPQRKSRAGSERNLRGHIPLVAIAGHQHHAEYRERLADRMFAFVGASSGSETQLYDLYIEPRMKS